MEVYGNEWVNTPNSYRLTYRRMTFDWRYSHGSVCTPSRSSFLIGRFPLTCRGRQNGANIPADEVLITKILSAGDYCCGLSGKLHISACNETAAPFGERRSDDGYAVFDWSHHPERNWPNDQCVNWLGENGRSFATEPFGAAHTSRPAWTPNGTRPTGALTKPWALSTRGPNSMIRGFIRSTSSTPPKLRYTALLSGASR